MVQQLISGFIYRFVFLLFVAFILVFCIIVMNT